MGWFRRFLRRLLRRTPPPTPAPFTVPLPLLVHTHSKDSRPPGPLEKGPVELEQDDLILHAVSGVIQPDGTVSDLQEDKLEWARRLTYRHLKREGCLADFGIPIIPAYEQGAEERGERGASAP